MNKIFTFPEALEWISFSKKRFLYSNIRISFKRTVINFKKYWNFKLENDSCFVYTDLKLYYVFSFYRMPFWQLMHLSTWYHLPKCKNCHNAIVVIARTSYSTLFTCLNIYYNHLVSMRFKHFICVLSINYDHFI